MTKNAITKELGPKNVHVVAGTPAEMQQAQNDLIQWADSRIEHERIEMADAQENLDIARKAKWRVAPWQRRLKQHKNKITFYEKIKAALKDGYYIVPPFPVQVFAVRTDQKKPRHQTSTSQWTTFEQSPRKLPQGQGRYVNPVPEVWRTTDTFTKKDGTEGEKTTYWPKEFTEADFPFKTVKPQILKATSKAMGEMLFDQIGILPRWQAGGDPIVVGQILHPQSSKPPVTFFISWWLDTTDL